VHYILNGAQGLDGGIGLWVFHSDTKSGEWATPGGGL